MKKPTVLINIDKDGGHEVAFAGDVDVFCIDENAKEDRVFKLSSQVTEREIQNALGSAVIGFTGDRSEAEMRMISGLNLTPKSLN